LPKNAPIEEYEVDIEEDEEEEKPKEEENDQSKKFFIFKYIFSPRLQF